MSSGSAIGEWEAQVQREGGKEGSGGGGCAWIQLYLKSDPSLPTAQFRAQSQEISLLSKLIPAGQLPLTVWNATPWWVGHRDHCPVSLYP